MAEEVPARGSIFGKCLPARFVLAILGSIGMAIIYGLKVNLSVTLVAMLNHTAIAEQNALSNIQQNTNNSTILTTNTSMILADLKDFFNNSTSGLSAIDVGECAGDVKTKKPEDGPFVWTEAIQGPILSSYFWGYIISEVPGAHVAENFSAKWVMFFAVAINIICTLLTPVLTELHFSLLIVMRLLEGIGGGVTFPAMHCLIASWAPPSERSVMSTIIYVGTSFGTAMSILLAGILSAKFGWESVFYIMGGLSSLWTILWIILIQDNPNKQRLISPEERQMITTSLGTNIQESGASQKVEHHPPVPWSKVIKSIPFWAILIAHCCSNWGWYMFLIEIPFYMKQVLHFDVSSNAVASALPYFPMLIFSVILGKTLDTLKAKQKINTTIARKIATSFSTVVPGVCLLALCFIGCHHTAAVVIMTIGIVGMGGMFSGFLSNHIDIAPNYAGTLVAITNTAATVPGIIVPFFVGWITKGNQTIDAWRVIFFVTIILFTIEIIVFAIFGSGEEQSWNKSGKQHEFEHGATTESTPLKAGNQSPTNVDGH